ncbi:MAG: S41 family peptidase [Xanthomonadales bacterium]|nr:S41 family peptidase [Xanthomonadales bacterium]
MQITRLLTILLLCWLMPAAQAAEEAPAPGNALTLDELRTFTDVFNQVRNNYVEDISEQTLLRYAIEGMVQQLDPWSEFMDAETFRQLGDVSAGRYGGIGVRVDILAQRLFIEAVTPGGPASEARILSGDQLLAVDGVPVRGRPLGDSMDALLGEPGSTVELRVRSPGEAARELTVTRDYLTVPSVFRKPVDGDIGLFHVSHFTRHSHEELRAAIDDLGADLGGPLSGIILDLRGNPGGVIDSAVAIADGFLDRGLIVYTRSRYAPTQIEFRAEPGQWTEALPLVILVDSRTASAAEVLTGALKDHGRATVIGARTYGKGSIQSVLALRNGAGLKLTTAHYFTPSDTVIQGHGIVPDLVLEDQSVEVLETTELDAGIRAAIRTIRGKSLP